MSVISLNAFLAQIDQNVSEGKPVYFSVTFVKVGKSDKDKERGKLRHVERASKGWKEPKISTQKGTSDKDFYNVKEHGVLVLYDHTRGEVFTPLIDLVIYYNGLKIVR
jgi:hypothetical protein